MAPGSDEQTFTDPVDDDEPQHALIREYRLRVTAGPDKGKSFTANRERAVVGTHESTDFTLTDPTTSRFHCELILDKDRVVVRDLESKNGTIVNGVDVAKAVVPVGATLTLGKTQVRFELGDDQIKIPLSPRMRFGVLVAKARSMRTVFASLEQAAKSDSTVLLQGETGAGKDFAAESIHRESARKDGPFMVVDCGAIPPNLLESELFGHERGAFTGADRARPGVFEAAAGGTVFLDEIAELSLDLQPKLLRVLERREIRRVGGNERIPIDVRVIAATNRDLYAEVNARRFRSDLYYRLAVLVIRMPPLRERTEDLPLLIEDLLKRMDASDHPATFKLRSTEFLAQLAAHPWPGNVRELRNYLERTLADPDSGLPTSGADDEGGGGIKQPAIDPTKPIRPAREEWVRYFERQYLEALLAKHNGNVSAAARTAGVDRIHLYRLMSRCGLR